MSGLVRTQTDCYNVCFHCLFLCVGLCRCWLVGWRVEWQTGSVSRQLCEVIHSWSRKRGEILFLSLFDTL